MDEPKKQLTGTMVTHTIRTADDGRITLKYGRKKAIYLFCTECFGWETHPSECTSPLCPLFPFRGKTLASKHGEEE